MKDYYSAALDIGTTKISLTIGRKCNIEDKYRPAMEVLAHTYVNTLSVNNGTVKNIDKLSNDVAYLINEVKNQCGIKVNQVNATVGTPFIKYVHNYGNTIKNENDGEISNGDIEKLKQDMYKIVVPPGHTILHVIPQYYVLDNEIEVQDPIGCSAVQVEGSYKIIIVNAVALKHLEKGITKSGLQLNNLLLQPLSSSVSVLSEVEKKMGVCLVDIGGGTTDIAIFNEGRIRHIASIPMGSNLITQDLKIGLSVMEEQAELIKTQLGKAILDVEDAQMVLTIPPIKSGLSRMITARNINNIIEARIVEILEMVHKEILSSQIKLDAGIVLTGGGALLKDIDRLCELVCSSHCRIGYPVEGIDFNDFQQANLPCFAAGLGLAREFLDPSQYPWSREKEVTESFNLNKVMKKNDSFSSRFNYNIILEKLRRILLDDIKYEY